MGSLDINSNDTPLELEPVPVTASNGNEVRVYASTAGLKSEHATASNYKELNVDSPTSPDEDNQFASSKKLLSFTSCSSSISSFDDPFQDSDSENDKSSFKFGANDRLATKRRGQRSASKIPITSSGSAAKNHISETPPIQVMERQTTSDYRIPSHVFSRKKSTAPGEWSINSNESLFSIQMGGRSFCNQDSLFFKSGDLGPGLAAETSTSNRSYDYQLLSGKTTEAGKDLELDKTGKNVKLGEIGKNHELGGTGEVPKVGEADKGHEFGKLNNKQGSIVPDEPMILRDNKEDQGRRSSTTEERFSHHSVESGSSAKSFVFPILAGETEKGNLTKMGGSPKKVSEEPKPEAQPKPPPKPEPQSKPPPKPEPQSKPGAPKGKAKTPAAIPSINWKKWFPCFRYCTCCSS